MRNVLIFAALLGLAACPKPPEASQAPLQEGYCEHDVLSAVCPKCVPALAAVFQAKGDWCPEHGFPESFCPLCHPERGGRPLADVSADGAPADGTKVRFKAKNTSARAGIEVEVAVEASGENGVDALARIAFDATKHAIVNTSVSGVVRTVLVDVGSKVSRTSVLARLESASLVADRSQLEAARARANAAEANLLRESGLLEKGVSSRRDVEVAQKEVAEAKGVLAAIEGSLGIVGGAGSDAMYELRAPIAGVIIRRTVTIGSLVEVGAPLFEIVDTSSMWAEIEVPEGDAGAVTLGQEVLLKIDGLQESITGKVEFLSPEIDPRTRTVLARARVDNSGQLRANMFARAKISIGGDAKAVVVPRGAIQRAKGATLVFVRLADDQYEARRVEVARFDGERAVLRKGIKPGEAVVTTGSFLLKTETLKDSIGAGCCDADERK